MPEAVVTADLLTTLHEHGSAIDMGEASSGEALEMPTPKEVGISASKKAAKANGCIVLLSLFVADPEKFRSRSTLTPPRVVSTQP